MTATKLDITIEQGVDFQQDFLITDESITTAELVGASAVAQFRKSYDDPDVLFTLETADGSLSITERCRKN